MSRPCLSWRHWATGIRSTRLPPRAPPLGWRRLRPLPRAPLAPRSLPWAAPTLRWRALATPFQRWLSTLRSAPIAVSHGGTMACMHLPPHHLPTCLATCAPFSHSPLPSPNISPGYVTILEEKRAVLLAVNPNTVVVVNPSMPRLSSFELTVPSGAWRSVMAEERRGKGEGTDLTASLCLSPSPHDGKQQGQPGATEPKTMCCGGTMGGLGRVIVLVFVFTRSAIQILFKPPYRPHPSCQRCLCVANCRKLVGPTTCRTSFRATRSSRQPTKPFLVSRRGRRSTSAYPFTRDTAPVLACGSFVGDDYDSLFFFRRNLYTWNGGGGMRAGKHDSRLVQYYCHQRFDSMCGHCPHRGC